MEGVHGERVEGVHGESGERERVEGVHGESMHDHSQRGALNDTAMIICKGV